MGREGGEERMKGKKSFGGLLRGKGGVSVGSGKKVCMGDEGMVGRDGVKVRMLRKDGVSEESRGGGCGLGGELLGWGY